LPGAIGKKHDVDLSDEQEPDTKPMPKNIYKKIKNANEAKGSMMFLEEQNMIERLFERGNSVDDLIVFFGDVIKACKRYGVELSSRFARIAQELGV